MRKSLSKNELSVGLDTSLWHFCFGGIGAPYLFNFKVSFSDIRSY